MTNLTFLILFESKKNNIFDGEDDVVYLEKLVKYFSL